MERLNINRSRATTWPWWTQVKNFFMELTVLKLHPLIFLMATGGHVIANRRLTAAARSVVIWNHVSGHVKFSVLYCYW